MDVKDFIVSTIGTELRDTVDLILTDPPWNVLRSQKGKTELREDDRVCLVYVHHGTLLVHIYMCYLAVL